MGPDALNAGLELGGSLFAAANLRKLFKDRRVQGVYVLPTAYMAVWGWWNLYWYVHVDAPLSWWASLPLVAANTAWWLAAAWFVSRSQDAAV